VDERYLSLHLSQPAYFSAGYCNSQSDISSAQRPSPLRARYRKSLNIEVYESFHCRKSLGLAIKTSRVRLPASRSCVTTLGKVFTPVCIDSDSLRYYTESLSWVPLPLRIFSVGFYREMLCIRGTGRGPVSVRHKSEFN